MQKMLLPKNFDPPYYTLFKISIQLLNLNKK
jgi:hypothetical protein